MAYDPMEGFQIGQAIGKSKGSAYGNTAKYMSDLEAERDKTAKKVDPITLLMMKNAFPSAKDQAATDLARDRQGLVQAQTNVWKNGVPTEIINPNTGEVTQGQNVPKGAKMIRMNTPSAQESASLSDIDEVLKTLPNIRTKLQSNPSLSATGRFPFVDPSYKADYDYLTKTLSSIVGGKNLTLPERQIVQTNLPGFQDMFDSPTLMKKLDRIERVMGGVKSRLSSGSFGNQPEAQYQVGQIIDVRGKKYRVMDNSDPNDPDLEPA